MAICFASWMTSTRTTFCRGTIQTPCCSPRWRPVARRTDIPARRNHPRHQSHKNRPSVQKRPSVRRPCSVCLLLIPQRQAQRTNRAPSRQRLRGASRQRLQRASRLPLQPRGQLLFRRTNQPRDQHLSRHPNQPRGQHLSRRANRQSCLLANQTLRRSFGILTSTPLTTGVFSAVTTRTGWTLLTTVTPTCSPPSTYAVSSTTALTARPPSPTPPPLSPPTLLLPATFSHISTRISILWGTRTECGSTEARRHTLPTGVSRLTRSTRGGGHSAPAT